MIQRSKKERERWTEAIVRDELARPAEISEMFLKDWEKRQEENRARQLQVRSSDMQHSSSRRRNVEVFILEEDHVYIRTRSSFCALLGVFPHQSSAR